MSPPVDAPTAPKPKLKDPPPTQPNVDIALGTAVNGTTITITGNGDATLPQGQSATVFNFTLNDGSGANVQFSSLDAKDGISTCPPVGSGNLSGQINGVNMHNNKTPRTAHFTDSNSNDPANGTLNVSYQWEFTCNSGYTVEPFDPIIKNGGKSGPIT